jgi:hypothetical protein
LADKSATKLSYSRLPDAQDRRQRCSAPLACLAFLLAWALQGSALAYNEGGHYYTLVALLDSRAGTMKTYATGAGHLFDGHKPDYIGRHQENSWDKFVQMENGALLSPPLAGMPLASLLSCRADCGILQSCESEDQDNLHRLIEQNEGSAHRIFINDMEQLIKTEDTDFMGFELADTCQEAVGKVYGKTGPDCASAWATYLGVAIEAFNKLSIDSTNRPGATPGTVARHGAAAAAGDAGERYGSCKPQIIDELKMGIPQ